MINRLSICFLIVLFSYLVIIQLLWNYTSSSNISLSYPGAEVDPAAVEGLVQVKVDAPVESVRRRRRRRRRRRPLRRRGGGAVEVRRAPQVLGELAVRCAGVRARGRGMRGRWKRTLGYITAASG